MILVTGGTGLVGSHLLYDLTKSGKKVRVLKRKNSNTKILDKIFSYYTNAPEPLIQLIEWMDADLSDSYSLLEAMEDITEVYHCAAMVSFSPKDREELKKVNVEGTTNLVNAALEIGVRKFCHVSSIAAIGRNEHGGLTNENNFWKYSPEHSMYSITKYNAEREVWRAAEEGLDVVIVNPALIFGPSNWTQSSSHMFSKAYKGINFYTAGINGFVDVRDVVKLSIMLMESKIKNERYILCSESVGFKFVFDVMHEALGKKKPTIKAGKFLTGLAWRAEKLRSIFTGSSPLITKETAQTGHRISKFSNAKILNVFPDYKFIPIEQSVKDTSRLFLKDLASPSE